MARSSLLNKKGCCPVRIFTEKAAARAFRENQFPLANFFYRLQFTLAESRSRELPPTMITNSPGSQSYLSDEL